MADTMISALTAVASVDGTEEYGVNESGTTKKATGAQQATFQEARLQQGVLCTHATDQTVTTGTWTPLEWDTETWKVGDSAIHSTSSNPERMTAQVAGEYLPVGVVSVEPIAGSFMVQLRTRVNATGEAAQIRAMSIDNVAVGSILNIPLAPVQLGASDYLTIEFRHERGSDVDVTSVGSTFGMYLLGR